MSRYIIILTTVVAVLTLTVGCTKPDRSDEAVALSKEIVNHGLSDVGHSVERVDSAEQAGLFTAVRANTIKAIIYENAGRRRLAAYYASMRMPAEGGWRPITQRKRLLQRRDIPSPRRQTAAFIVRFAVFWVTMHTPMASMVNQSPSPRKSLHSWVTAQRQMTWR